MFCFHSNKLDEQSPVACDSFALVRCTVAPQALPLDLRLGVPIWGALSAALFCDVWKSGGGEAFRVCAQFI